MRNLLERFEGRAALLVEQWAWDDWTRDLGWEGPTLRVEAVMPSPGPWLLDLYVVDLTGLGHVGVLGLPRMTPEPSSLGARGRKLTLAQQKEHAARAAKVAAERAAIQGALDEVQGALRQAKGGTSFPQVWAVLKGAAERANRALPAPLHVSVTEGAAIPPRYEALRRPVGLEHDGRELWGKGFVVSYTWPKVALRTTAGQPVALRTGAAGKYAVGTMMAQWIDAHAAALPGMDLAALRAGLRAARVPVDFALPGE
jgi:hypothetical protein